MIQLTVGDSFTAMYIGYMDIIQCNIVTNIDRKYFIMLTWTSSNEICENIYELNPLSMYFFNWSNAQCTSWDGTHTNTS